MYITWPNATHMAAHAREVKEAIWLLPKMTLPSCSYSVMRISMKHLLRIWVMVGRCTRQGGLDEFGRASPVRSIQANFIGTNGHLLSIVQLRYGETSNGVHVDVGVKKLPVLEP